MSLVLSQPIIELPDSPPVRVGPRMVSTRRVALAVPMRSRRFHEIVRGITDWAVRHADWSLTTFSGTDCDGGAGSGSDGDCLAQLADWRGDGFIAAIQTERDASAVAHVGLPCVNLSSSLAGSDLPRVTVDNDAVGRLAADHLLACGFRRFAYYGPRGVRFSHQREAGFVRQLEAKGFVADVCASPFRKTAAGATDAELISLCAWLRRSERPLAVFAANDQLARNVLRACFELSLRVPEHVAVLGVDDDVLICNQTTPTLSSIACDWRGVGYQAAAMLDRLMGFDPAAAAAPPHHLVQTAGLMRRASTDIALGPTTAVTSAVKFVREHIHEVFGVEALLRVTRVPRRSLELEFRRSIGCTPYQYITRARVARAKELLSASKPQKLSAIAGACGFADLRRFRLVFRREVGISPAEYGAAQHKRQD